MIILLGLGFALSANAAQPVLNFNAGAVSDGQQIMNSEVWNDVGTRGGITITNLQYADGTDATGITVQQVAQGRNDPSANGYDTNLVAMTTDGLWSNFPNHSSLTVSGLRIGSSWNVAVYAGVTSAGNTQTNILNVVGTTTNSYGPTVYNALVALGVPVTFSNVVTDASGSILIDSIGDGGSAYLLGATLTDLTPTATAICIQ